MTSKKLLFQIKLAMLHKDVLQKDIAEKTGINLRTLQRRFENPSDFTVDELIKISEMLDIWFDFTYMNTFFPTFNNPININDPKGDQYNKCEGCIIYEEMKKGKSVVNDRCTFCSENPYKITCETTNNNEDTL